MQARIARESIGSRIDPPTEGRNSRVSNIVSSSITVPSAKPVGTGKFVFVSKYVVNFFDNRCARKHSLISLRLHRRLRKCDADSLRVSGVSTSVGEP
jgi:hypothetical protein